MKFKDFYYLEEKWDVVANVKNIPIRVSIDDLDIITTGHGDDQRSRHAGTGEAEIKKEEIIQTLERALPKIFQDYANGEIANEAEFIVKNRITDLNVVGTIVMRKGPDMIRVITVMRKKNFVPKSGTAKVYTV